MEENDGSLKCGMIIVIFKKNLRLYYNYYGLWVIKWDRWVMNKIKDKRI